MRKIKFRGKSLRAGKWSKWIYGSLDCTKYTYKECRMVAYDDPIQYRHTVDKETVGQYTGLKDKNGKEIYEGDIVFIKGETKLLDITGKVEYSNILAQFIITNTGSIVNEAEPLGDYEEEDIEVIGNEFDNPELLEKG